MRIRPIVATLLVLLAAAAAAATARAGDVFEGWHRKPEDGQAAAKRSGRPVFLVTLWADGV